MGSSYTLRKSTILPAGTDPLAAIALLHNHDVILHLNPLVESSILLPAEITLTPHDYFPIPYGPDPMPSSPEPADALNGNAVLQKASVCEVTELLHGGKGLMHTVMSALGLGKVVFRVRMQDRTQGLRTDVEAPMGFRSYVEWKIRKAVPEEITESEEHNDAKSERWMLDEECTIAAAAPLVWFAKPQLDEAHRQLHLGFIDALQKRSE